VLFCYEKQLTSFILIFSQSFNFNVQSEECDLLTNNAKKAAFISELRLHDRVCMMCKGSWDELSTKEIPYGENQLLFHVCGHRSAQSPHQLYSRLRLLGSAL